jgi:hypothetical protein
MVMKRGVVGLALILSGCVGPAPYDDYSLAYTSIEAARQAQAPRFSPGFFSQAEEHYRRALVDFNDRRYVEAKNNFVMARKLAEKSENYTVLKKAETGDVE